MPQAGVRGARPNVMALVRGSTANHRHLRNRLLGLWGFTVAADLVFSVLAHLVETGAPGSGLHNYGDALFWTSTQLLTISSSLPNPVTGWGQVIDVVMEFIGITLITAQAGALGSFLYRHSVELSSPAHVKKIEQIVELVKKDLAGEKDRTTSSSEQQETA